MHTGQSVPKMRRSASQISRTSSIADWNAVGRHPAGAGSSMKPEIFRYTFGRRTSSEIARFHALRADGSAGKRHQMIDDAGADARCLEQTQGDL